MKMHIHELSGCAPAPLAHYLKALGILRLVAEQADPQARGWWEGERFRLATVLGRDALERFFLEKYEPTPIFNPWGGRSGFYPGSSEKSARLVLENIEQTSDLRFKVYKETVKVVRATLTTVTKGKKPDDDDKSRLIQSLRHSVRGKSTLWLDAVASIIGAGNELEVKHPAIFGTGGNEGSGSYTAAYMAAIEQCLMKKAWAHALPLVLFSESTNPHCDWAQSMGQFIPGAAATPWDLLLALEGGCIVRSAVATRSSTSSTRWMSSPFYMAPTSFGYPSEARIDEFKLNKGKELPGQGEQWFPLWRQPMLASEVSQMFVDGRATTVRGKAVDAWSMVRAIASLGVRQGIHEFVRYGYQQRNNLATHFAVPLGRFRVPEKLSPQLPCLDDLDRYRWLFTLRREARDKNAPARFRQAERALGDALFAVTQNPENPADWQAVLLALAKVEAVMVSGSGFRAGPIPPLRPEWVAAANDGSAEFRLALALALQTDPDNRYDWTSSVRRHWLPMQGRGQFAKSGTGTQTRLLKRTDVVIHGRSGLDDAIALVRRRLIEAAQNGRRRLPLAPTQRDGATPADIGRLLAGGIDLDRTLELSRALMALDLRRWKGDCVPPSSWQHDTPDDAWLAIRLAHLPWPLKDGLEIGIDPAILRRLESGDAATAFELARRRLRAAGIGTTVQCATVSPETARLWAAALAFPISKNTAGYFVRRLDPNANI
ncbi:type I-G CRISPR-associated protein Cas8g1/Csx17 [Trichloromonas sp.]|uniref:type I-G CRISPR-associated protein Cas8g1/Csx17 n=1 Tax=Trichloromonas sp. TaxID=3069249 RepID=UPI002A451A8C|nr:type I-U CRISPR-associated protein Csx17 [Trichloromonas sp.]